MIRVRRIRKGDLAAVRDVVEAAFGDFLERLHGERPRPVFGGAQYVHHRWLMEPWGCFVAEAQDGKIVGGSIAVTWGSIGILGPLAVATAYQGQKVGQQLLKATQGFFHENRVGLHGLATYPQSPRHLALYGKFGYRPRFLMAVMSKTLDRIEPGRGSKLPRGVRVQNFSKLTEREKRATLPKLTQITNRIYPGMNVSKEVEIVDGLSLGDTLVLVREGTVQGFSIYHTAAGSEAPTGAGLIKFLAVDPYRKRPEHFLQLLAACEDMVTTAGHQRIVAPIYTAYHRAYELIQQERYRVEFTLVRMKQGKNQDYDDPEGFVLDDWR